MLLNDLFLLLVVNPTLFGLQLCYIASINDQYTTYSIGLDWIGLEPTGNDGSFWQ